jgi:hypothetical protein
VLDTTLAHLNTDVVLENTHVKGVTKPHKSLNNADFKEYSNLLQ